MISFLFGPSPILSIVRVATGLHRWYLANLNSQPNLSYYPVTNYYQVLGLSSSATPEQIKVAYREFAKHFHPDKHTNSDFFKRQFQEVQHAYEVLSNNSARSSYDNERNLSSFSDEEYVLLKAHIILLTERLTKNQNLLKKESEENAKLTAEMTSKATALRVTSERVSILESELKISRKALAESLASNYKEESEYKAKLEKKSKAKYEKELALKKVGESFFTLLLYWLKYNRLQISVSVLTFVLVIGSSMYWFINYLKNQEEAKRPYYASQAMDNIHSADTTTFYLNSEKVLKSRTDFKDLRILRAAIYRSQKKYLPALSDYKLVYKYDSLNADVVLSMGDCYDNLGRTDSANIYWKTAYRLGSEDALYRISE